MADKFNLRPNIQFNSRVKSAVYDEKANRWDVQLESGQRARAQFLVAAVGILSARYTPPFPGVDSFKGESYHTSRWPKEKVDFTGKRVAVIGTGATAVQLIPIVAKEVGHLTVFQRTRQLLCAVAQWAGLPGDPEAVEGQLRQKFTKSVAKPRRGLRTTSIRVSPCRVSKEERLAQYEKLWAQPGFSKWLANFRDIMTNREANEDFAEFVRNKIRARVKDPGRGGKARAQGPSVRLQAHSLGDRVLRGLQSRQRPAG